MSDTPGYAEVLGAHARIAPFAHRTPVLTCSALDAMTGASLFFKCENFQKVGAFKFRGACNAVFSVPEDEAARGFATHSSGNHAAALALAGRLRSAAVTVVMPSNSSRAKLVAVEGYGARIVHCEPSQRSREETIEAVLAETGARFVSPYADPQVIAGQGTAALELLEDAGPLDVVMTPVGGGGLISGTVLAVKGRSPATRIIGAEPARADDAARSLEAGHVVEIPPPDTVADGLRTSHIGELNFRIMSAGLERIVRVEEQAIVDAMRTVWQRMKIIIEPSCAVPVAALLSGGLKLPGQRVGIVLSGGNVDLDALPLVRRLRPALLALALVPGALAAQWDIETAAEAGAPGEPERRLAVGRNDAGDSLAISRGEDDSVQAVFRLRPGLSSLARGCPSYRVDDEPPRALVSNGDMCRADGRSVTFVLGRIEEGKVDSEALLELMNGSGIRFIYHLHGAGYEEAAFSLSGSKQAIDEVLGGGVVVNGG